MIVNSYNSAKTLSFLAIAGLGLMALCNLIGAVLGVGQIINPAMTMDLDDGEPTSFWIALQGLVALLEFPIYIFTVVFFLIWLNRVYKNLIPLMAENLEFSSGWAVGWWFIPFANLVKPFQVVREAWRESDPDFDSESGFLSVSPGAPTYIGFWWAFWIISNVLTNFTSSVFEYQDAKSVEMSGYLFIVTGIFTTVAAVLAIKVVRDITQRQEKRFHNIATAQQFSSPPPSAYFNQDK